MSYTEVDTTRTSVAPRPTVLVVTMGAKYQMIASTAWQEFERCLRQFTDVTLAPVPVFHGDPRWEVRRVLGQSRRYAIRPNRPQRPKAESALYDLALVICASPFDLMMAMWAPKKLANARRTAAWVIEAWPTDCTKRAIHLEPYEFFDHVFVGLAEGAEALDAIVGHRTSVNYLPLAADTETFGMTAPSKARPILAFNPGRRTPNQHTALLKAASDLESLYLYDTMRSPTAIDPQEHRQSYASLCDNAELMVSNYAKFDQPQVIGQSREVPGRVYEALASACLPAGVSPSAYCLRQTGLPEDLVANFPLEDSFGTESIRALRDRAQETRSDLLALARGDHDWVHRWIRICERVGMPPGPEAMARKDRLSNTSSTTKPIQDVVPVVEP